MKRMMIFMLSLFLSHWPLALSCASEIEEKERAIKEALLIASAAQPKLLKLGLVDCITYALKQNSEIKIEKIEPLIAAQDVKIATADFAPVLSAEGSLTDTKTEPPSTLVGSHNRTANANFAIDGKFPLGTEYQLNFANKKYKDNSRYLGLNPYYESEFAVTITQPLFKDAGTRVNRAQISIAKNNLEKSNQNLQQELIDAVSKAKRAYYSYVLSIERNKTAQVSLQRAQDLLAIVQKRKDQGLASSIDLLESKTGVAERQDLLVGTEKALKAAEDELKYATNLINDPELWYAQIEPLDRPEFKEDAVDLLDSFQLALDHRPDYAAAKIELSNQDIRIKVDQNALLPTIDLVGSLGLNGLAADYKGALKSDYKEWTTAVKVSYPWGSQPAKANLAKADLAKKQLLISFERLQQRIILEVRDAVRAVEAARTKVATARERRQTEQARYQAVERRFQDGLVSAHDMLEYQEDLSAAETGYVQSLIDYSTSLIELEKTIGVTLVRNNIRLEE